MVRVGVVGAGWFASRRHLPELAKHPEVELAALCRRSPEPLARLAEHFGVPETYTGLDDMLGHARLDAVLVCSPHNLHHAHASVCLAAGCHVLMEKPMTIATADAVDLAARADAAGKLLEIAYNPPWWPHTLWLKERVEAGELGEVEAVDIRWSGDIRGVFGRQPLPENLPGVVPPTMFRGDVEANGGGHLIDGGSHQVCEALWVTGLPLRDVSASMDAVPDDIRFALQMTFTNGAFGSISSIGDSGYPGRQVWGMYLGSRATALVRGMPFEITWLAAGQPPVVVTEKDMPAPPQPANSFVDAVLGRAGLRCPGRDCVRYVQAVEAAYESARTGRRVAVEPGGIPAPG
ncbi:MAG: Gfo/Idh/MocA family oxidoreductase [Armatimonadetes bacterium]|nr:Gfo/Idh/MocA family oxidoreductase [Armatimonadota bacterium]